SQVASLETAYETFIEVDSVISLLRHTYWNRGSKEAMASYTKAIYERAIEVCLALHAETQDPQHQHMAFYFAENSRAVILLDAIQRARLLEDLLPPAKKEQLTHLSQRRIAYEKLLASAPEEVFPTYLDSAIKYRGLEASFMENTFRDRPLHASINEAAPVVLDRLFNDMGQLPADRAWLEYFVGERNLYAFIGTHQSFEVVTIEKDFPLEEWVGEVRFQLCDSAARGQPQSHAAFCRLSFQLYEKLLAPVLQVVDLPQKLTLIRDESLEMLPFDLLLTERGGEAPAVSGLPYLLRDHLISYAHSLRLQQIFEANQISPRRGMASYAPVNFDQLSLSYADETSAAQWLPSLPYTENEVSGYTWSDLFLESQAKLQNFLEGSEDYALLYLVSHGILN
ncbi:MAG: CHAT domain-containing protein, partial [Bacteroidota bacterium]